MQALLLLGTCVAIGSAEEPKPVVRPISEADTVLAVYYQDWTRGSPRPDGLILAIWPDGHIVWSGDRVRGGPPYRQAEVDPKKVSALVGKFDTDGLFDDDKWNVGYWDPHADFLTVLVKSGKKKVSMCSDHEAAQANGFDVLHWKLPKRLDRRLEILREAPKDYLFFRVVWDDTRKRLAEFVPAEGSWTEGKPVWLHGVLTWEEPPAPAKPKDGLERLLAEWEADKLLGQVVDATALVFGPDGTKEPVPLAAALVLDRDKRLLLSTSRNVPDAPTVVFPAYTEKGEFRNATADYVALWKKGERRVGKVVHRDDRRGLAVIELGQPLPERARAAEFLPAHAQPGSDVYALVEPKRPDGRLWKIEKGIVRSYGDVDLHFGPDIARPKSPNRLMTTNPRGSGLDGGLYKAAGQVAGFASPPVSTVDEINKWIDVGEIREFLEDKKVPFRTAPKDGGGRHEK
jgi:hypothetical protein